MKITSLNNPYIKSLAELLKNKYKKERKEFLVDGDDFIELAYQAKCLKKLLVLEYLEKYNDIEQIEVTTQIIEKLSVNKSPSNVIGVCTYKEFGPLQGNKLVYLDGVQDPGNVGTIVRTALAFSYSAVVLSENCASIYNDKVISATKGAIFMIPILSIKAEDLQKKGYTLVVTSLKDAVCYKEYRPQGKFALILGNEGQGVSDDIMNIADVKIKIPMSNIDSLNVGVAAGILLNEYKE